MNGGSPSPVPVSMKSLSRTMQVQVWKIIAAIMESCRYFEVAYHNYTNKSSKLAGSVVTIATYILGLNNSQGNFEFSRYFYMNESENRKVVLDNPFSSDNALFFDNPPLAIGLLAIICFTCYCQELSIDRSQLFDVQSRPEYMNLIDAGTYIYDSEVV